MEGENSNFVMTCGTEILESQEPGEELSNGLVAGHCYTVLAAFEVKSNNN